MRETPYTPPHRYLSSNAFFEGQAEAVDDIVIATGTYCFNQV
jgi:hypothetical protein